MTGKLETRKGLPDALRVLVEELPRTGWEQHPNFDGMTRFWLDRHLMFRDVLGRLRTGTEAMLDNKMDTRQGAMQTARYAEFFLNGLHGHHHIEDSHYFPQLQALDARITPGFELLDADHVALSGHLNNLADTTNQMLRRLVEADGRERLGELHVALEAFEVFLDRHLTDEEDLIVPVILKYAPDLH